MKKQKRYFIVKKYYKKAEQKQEEQINEIPVLNLDDEDISSSENDDKEISEDNPFRN